ncbi:hypothetical protein WJX73_000650 [Symbiochloris irregularis]|uniref:Amidohydrolase-related domain-containing protein n=1 Tax=Symbiochloris irregularis TaxID=706552 RepID=A0AAW1P1N0_9CHLO
MPARQRSLLVKNIKVLATFNQEHGDIEDAAIYVEGPEIKWVGKSSSLPGHYQSADQVLDLSHCVAIPGLVNSHHHMFQTLTRCMAQDQKLFGWLKSCYPGWQHMTAQDYTAACRMAMAELILTGCTTSVDHHYFFPNDVRMDQGIQAARDLGLRFHAARGAMSKGQSKGGIPPDHVVETEADILADMERLIKEYHDNSRYSMTRLACGPVAQKGADDECFVKCAHLARQHEGVRLHTHLAENQEDVDYTMKNYGHRFTEYIRKIEWDREDCWFAHCCKLNHEEYTDLSARGIGVAHCPSSNMRLASGICPVRSMLDAGVNVGLGIDGSASNDSGHMMAEARLACFLQRAGGDPNGMSAREALRLGIQGGAKNLGRTDVGAIAPGMAADFVAWRTDTFGFAGAQHDLVAALIWCTPSIGTVHASIINGQVVVEDGKLQTGDLGQIVKDLNAASARILKHFP